jgi:hypothetical protein
LLLLAACNQLFGVKNTEPRDGSIDVVDAAASCPAIGSDLVMSPDLHQVFTETCTWYEVSPSGLASGLCLGQRGSAEFQNYVLTAGPVDQPLPVVDSLPDNSTLTQSEQISYSNPFPSPDGTRLYSRKQDYTFTTGTTVITFARFVRQSDGSWIEKDTVPIPNSYGIESTVFHGPAGDRFIEVDATQMMSEWSEDGGGGWTTGMPHSVTELGMSYVNAISLTSDGLRAAIQGQRTGDSFAQALYTDRPSIDDWFRPAVPLLGAPTTPLAITDACARIYVTGLGSVFYIQQP